KRLEEKLKETPEEPEKPVKTPEAQSSKTEIRSVLKENWYLALLKSKIENSWQQPSRVLLSGRDALKLTVGFTLQQNGTVANVRVIKSSGVAVVDISSVNAVKNAAPFPPAPEGSGSKPIDISIDFILKE
ncbi:MAG: TonB C-terminal domain-containing protein, partial [Candidatus Aureabacteria bacterium]|nr:TonB C-terminal domain-containing protein [Candidatus Auribacterota bacterium]